MKYGKNQWARISSLLVRKTPKQCKARWYEWLDPSIKKTEWSRDEEEKLLHLAKLMPTQWRTIAPMIGRTPAQCLEHYEQLLDAAASTGEEGSGLPSAEQARKLRPGEVDPSPENKPARPDPVDMDEDEKEMLSEARARLANTQGKKAKRKAREKLLEEAKRLASLQKRRELAAAGLTAPRGMRGGGAGRGGGSKINYNAEIPFERAPVPGFYDTTKELVHSTPVAKPSTDGAAVPSIQAPPKKPSRDAIEIAARKRDAAKERLSQEQGHLSTALERKLQEQEAMRRPALQLPRPDVSEADLETILKVGQTGQQATALALENATPASASLMAQTPSTPSLLRTPLVGNHPSASPFRRPGGATPIRDPLKINTPMHEEPSDVSMLMMQQQQTRQRLNDLLGRLPPPKNDFEIVVPTILEDEGDSE